MSSMLPVAVYGLKVPAGDVMMPAAAQFRATFHITMAALDPSAAPEHTGTANGNQPPRATLKLVYDTMIDEEDDAERKQMLKALMGAQEDDNEDEEDDEDEDEESSADDEEKNGGPSDPSKTKRARKQAAVAQLLKSFQNGVDVSSEDLDDVPEPPKVNGVLPKIDKGKGKAAADAMEESSSDEDKEEEDMKELVLCTLDTNQHYQQTLDITIPEDTNAYFKVSGTHAIYLTGNYVVSPDTGHDHDHDDDSEEYDMSPDLDELEDDYDENEESDELDDLEDPRITEVESEEEAPKLVKNEKTETVQKGKNKRLSEDSDEEPATLDAIMEKSLKPAEPAVTAAEPKLSKKQLKKLKNNAGKAVEAAVENKNVKKEDESSAPKNDKKVQFAKDLEQGPTGTTKETKPGKEVKQGSKGDTKPGKQENEMPKASLGVKTLQDGVKIDDRKLGTGRAAKKGDKVSMRYIGKLEDGRQFDANKKGPPFKFTIGQGEVIKGWDIGIAGMSAGGERRIDIPAKMAYGSKSQPGIPANSSLKFDVKLLSLN